MRFSYFLLVASVTLLASSSCNAAAATSDDQAKLSTMTSTDAAVSARELESNNGKRFLRSYREEDEDDEEEEEERSILTPTQLAKWTTRADEWVELGHSPAYIKDMLTGLNGKMTAKNKEKYRLFGAAWGRANPHELGRK